MAPEKQNPSRKDTPDVIGVVVIVVVATSPRPFPIIIGVVGVGRGRFTAPFFLAPSGRFPHRGIKDFRELKFFEVEAVRHLNTFFQGPKRKVVA